VAVKSGSAKLIWSLRFDMRTDRAVEVSIEEKVLKGHEVETEELHELYFVFET